VRLLAPGDAPHAPAQASCERIELSADVPTCHAPQGTEYYHPLFSPVVLFLLIDDI
jgi:hypothetical protein